MIEQDRKMICFYNVFKCFTTALLHNKFTLEKHSTYTLDVAFDHKEAIRASLKSSHTIFQISSCQNGKFRKLF